MKKLIVVIGLIMLSVSAKAHDAGSALLGVIIGAQIAQPIYRIYNSPVYIPSPQIYYPPPPPVVIYPSQAPYYDARLHGFCAPYQGIDYARCLDNVRRSEYEEFNRRQR